MSASDDNDSWDRLGVLLEQLEGMVAVGTHANFDELDAKETRTYLYAVHDVVLRCNEAFMAGRTQ